MAVFTHFRWRKDIFNIFMNYVPTQYTYIDRFKWSLSLNFPKSSNVFEYSNAFGYFRYLNSYELLESFEFSKDFGWNMSIFLFLPQIWFQQSGNLPGTDSLKHPVIYCIFQKLDCNLIDPNFDIKFLYQQLENAVVTESHEHFVNIWNQKDLNIRVLECLSQSARTRLDSKKAKSTQSFELFFAAPSKNKVNQKKNVINCLS